MIFSRQVHSSSMTFSNAHGSGIGGVKFELENKILYVKEWEYKFSASSSCSFFPFFLRYFFGIPSKVSISEKMLFAARKWECSQPHRKTRCFGGNCSLVRRISANLTTPVEILTGHKKKVGNLSECS